MSSTIKPIETRYAGCRFRSRLEARWAVFFDRIGIAWEYEPEGYMIGPEGDQRPYLPDFWLPAKRQWVEVKGAPMTLEERQRSAHAAVTHPGWGLPNNGNGLMLLGQVPRLMRDVLAFHPVLTFHKGDLMRHYRSWSSPQPIDWDWTIVTAVDGRGYELEGTTGVHSEWHSGFNAAPFLWDNGWAIDQSADRRTREAYTAARCARFEHGECG